MNVNENGAGGGTLHPEAAGDGAVRSRVQSPAPLGAKPARSALNGAIAGTLRHSGERSCQFFFRKRAAEISGEV